MGYYTKFTITFDPFTNEIKEHINNTNDSYLSYLDLWDNRYSLEAKWYDHEEDLKVLSAQFPDTLITVKGDGEESGDIWKKYFKNGKMQVSRGVITFEPFDEARLE